MKRFKTSYIAVLITQNVIKNRIRFNTSWRGAYIRERGGGGGVITERVFLLQVGAPITVGAISEGAYKEKCAVFLLPFSLVESSMAIQTVTKLSFV